MLELAVDRIAAGGDGVAREAGGRVVFVTGALPGERVRAELTDERRDFARAVAVEVLEPSPARVAPPCPFVAAGCGGCGWQHVDPVAQVGLKATIVTDALVRIGRLTDPVVETAEPLPATGFRTTVRAGVRDGRLGLHRARSHDVLPVDPCLVAHPLLQELMAETRLAGADEAVLRCSVATGERLVWPRPRTHGVTVPPGVRVGRRAAVHERVAGRLWKASAPSFFQSRPDGAEALVAAVIGAAGSRATTSGTLVDAYCGVGLFAGTMGRGRPVVAVESGPSSVADATENLRDVDATIVTADVAAWRAPRDLQPELVVADPPRDGLRRDAATRLARLGADRFVLVSCDAASLGRDAGLLTGLGYVHVRSLVVDLFPHTPHVEVVTRFDRR